MTLTTSFPWRHRRSPYNKSADGDTAGEIEDNSSTESWDHASQDLDLERGALSTRSPSVPPIARRTSYDSVNGDVDASCELSDDGAAEKPVTPHPCDSQWTDATTEAKVQGSDPSPTELGETPAEKERRELIQWHWYHWPGFVVCGWLHLLFTIGLLYSVGWTILHLPIALAYGFKYFAIFLAYGFNFFAIFYYALYFAIVWPFGVIMHFGLPLLGFAAEQVAESWPSGWDWCCWGHPEKGLQCFFL